MIRTDLSVVLFIAFALRASAADLSDKGTAPRPNVVPVSELLEQVAKSPLGPGEVILLRAVADLVEKEKVATSQASPTPGSRPVIVTTPVPAAAQAAPPIPSPDGVATEKRSRLAFRLSYAPAVDVARALEEFLVVDSEPRDGRAYGQMPNPNRVILVPVPLTNSLLVSGAPRMVDDVTKLIEHLDMAPPTVVLDVCIAELLPPSRDAKTDEDVLSNDSAVEKAPSMEKDGAAWLAWAGKHGHIEVLSRPQIMTLDNQRAIIKIGATAPTGTPQPGTDGPAKGNQIEQTEVGLTVDITPRISPQGLVFLVLEVEREWVVKRGGAVDPTIGKTTVQTTISAKDGQTTVLGGLMQRADDGPRQMIIAVTPWVNPKR
ncbi:MAG: hypothetical protein NTW96_26180 [Planctomycetia bacterium]|nr:hypothetical protein [Planctomycetia bacterium]